MGRELAERAQRLCSENVSVDAAIRELIRLADGNRFDLSAAYAIAVQGGGGVVTPGAALLELVMYESEGRLRAAVNDPDRLPGRLLAGFTRAQLWGIHWAVLAVMFAVASLTAEPGFARWLMAGYAVLFSAQVALIWWANRRREAPWEGAQQSERAGAVPPLAGRVARESVIIVRAGGDPDPIDRLRRFAVGDLDTPFARRRATFVLREAARLLAASPLLPRDYRRARELVTTARLDDADRSGRRHT
jgi:hypothetical protein